MVDVNTQNKTISVNVSSSGVSSNVNASGDTSHYYSEKAREWAISNRIVDGVDYSSKYYAGRANQSALNAQSFAQSAQDSYNNFQQSVDGALNTVNDSVQTAITTIDTKSGEAIETINNSVDGVIEDIEAEANEQIANIERTGFYMRDDKLYFINSNGEEEEFKSGGGGLEIGDIGIAPLGIDETKGKRRYLNGQLIIQEQYVQFTNKVKSAVALYPSLACTESEWQTTATMTVGGQVGKFVVDDEAGTIRLPKIIMPIQGLTDLSKLGEIIEAGLPNITGTHSGLEASGFNTTGCFYDTGNSVASAASGHSDPVLGFDASRSSAVYGNSTTVQQEQIQYPYFIQVATGAETEHNIINEIELNNPFSLLDYKYTEAPLYNVSWLLANGTFNGSNAIHPNVYQALLIELNTDIETGTTQNNYTKRGLPVKLSTDTYTDYDFVLNTAEETFRLPVKVKLASGKAVVGNGMTLGLDNGKNFGFVTTQNATVNSYQYYTGAYGTNKGLYFVNGDSGSGRMSDKNGYTVGITTDPTKSGIETSDSDLFLYFYVGETVQNANLINAGRIEEKISNLIPDNSSLISSYAMPSGRYIDLTVGANESTYTAPADGWFFAQNNVTGASGLTLYNETKGYFMGNCVERAWALPILLPCQKDDLVKLSCWNQMNIVAFRFYYLEGDQ